MALGPVYLIDRSAWEQRRYDVRARSRIRQLRESNQLAICVVTMAELLYSARDAAEMATDYSHLASLPYLATTAAAETQVAVTSKDLAAKGVQHRGRPIPDILFAAIAQSHGAVVLHYDHDFELIANVTGQSHEWIIPAGTGHRGTDSAGD